MRTFLLSLSLTLLSLFHLLLLTVPQLEFFEAESLGDGRSILLQWKLQYSGGHPVNSFIIEVSEVMYSGVRWGRRIGTPLVQVIEEDDVIQTLKPDDVYEGSLLLDDLRPSTNYSFRAVVGNSLGLATPLETNASTPIGI